MKSQSFRLLRQFLAAIMLLVLVPSLHGQIKVTLIQVNDVYEIAGLNGGKLGNLARIAALKNQYAAKGPTLLFMAGDFVSPSAMNKVEYEGENIEGRQMVDIMNRIAVDAVCFGNHEFDIKEKFLLKRINESRFTWISTNAQHVANGDTSRFQRFEAPLPEYYFRTFVNGHDSIDIGMFGIVLPFNKAPYVAYENPENAARRAAAAIRPQCDVLIGLTHQNRGEDSLLARNVPGIDLILGGHEHEWMKFTSGKTLITKADANAKTAWVHTLSWKSSSGKLKIKSKLVSIDEHIKPDPIVEIAVQNWMNICFDALRKSGFNPEEVVLTTSQQLDGREGSVRNGSTLLTRLIADACQWFAPTVDAVMYNAGSIRVDDILSGTITQYDILRTLPFGGEMLEVTLTGADLIKALDTGTTTNRGIGAYLQFTNLTGSAGNWSLKGQPIDLTRTYRVLMPTFLATVGDSNLGFLTASPHQAPTGTQAQVVNDIRNITIAYLKTNPVIK